MRQTIVFFIVFSAILLYLIGMGSSQITFSKGWGPGKRAVYDENCRMNAKSAIAIYYTIMSKLKRLMLCEQRRFLGIRMNEHQ